MHFTALLNDNHVAPLRTTASTNHSAPWWECRTASPQNLAIQRRTAKHFLQNIIIYIFIQATVRNLFLKNKDNSRFLSLTPLS